ncbi:MAG: hypothetical protein NUV46_00575 [Nanoarchaeota archaeon]|nr:hypothetical protein [Nanoarchaeota archaeon]
MKSKKSKDNPVKKENKIPQVKAGDYVFFVRKKKIFDIRRIVK